MEIGGRGSFPRNTLEAATINIVLDHLSDFEIVSTHENPNRTVSWCSAPLPPDKQAPYDDRVTLYVIEASDAEELFAQHPHAIGLIALQQDEPFSPDAPPLPRRIPSPSHRHPQQSADRQDKAFGGRHVDGLFLPLLDT